MWLLRLVLVVAVVVAVWYVVRAVRAGGAPTLGTAVRFVPVEQLPADQRQAIEAQLAQGRTTHAVTLYREATGAGPKEARTAVETYRWKQGGAGAAS